MKKQIEWHIENAPQYIIDRAMRKCQHTFNGDAGLLLKGLGIVRNGSYFTKLNAANHAFIELSNKYNCKQGQLELMVIYNQERLDKYE